MIYLRLFYEFFKIGLFAIGGGLAALPFLFDLAERYPWFSKDQLTDMIAVAESTPGPLGINMSTFAGYQTGGVWGGILATFAIVLPSFLITLLVSRFLHKFAANPLVEDAFYGLRPAVAGLIGAVAVGLLGISLFDGARQGLLWGLDYKAAILFAALLPLVFKFKKHPIVYIAAAAVVGIIFKF
ncbi:MAG: chromate transporter [Firmicutes bacterium]|nr:chromate transporter [Bacillota bacterium]